MEIEHELKFLLSADEAQVLLEWAETTHGGPIAGKQQVNVYFDTKSRDFGARKWMFRTRFKKGKKQTTLKTPVEDEFGLKNKEYECALPDDFPHDGLTLDLDPSIPVFKSILELAEAEGFVPGRLVCTGKLETTRHAFDGPSGLKIELDHSFYADTEDWEVECESDKAAEAHQILVNWFAELGVSPVGNKRSKYVRMLDASK